MVVGLVGGYTRCTVCTARSKHGTLRGERTENTAQSIGSRVRGPQSKNRALKALGVTTLVEHERKENGWYIYVYIYIHICTYIHAHTYTHTWS